MKAGVVNGDGKIRLQDIELRELEEGEALVKVLCTGICGTDVHVQHGKHKTAKLPVITGHEFVGEVAEVRGKGAEKFNPGDRVVVQPYFSCGRCDACASGKDNICEELAFMGAHTNGSFADYTIAPTRKMYKIPKDMDLELAALTEPVAVAVHDVKNSGLQVADKALVIGGGPIGMLIAIVARHSGASDVVISEISEFRRSFAEELGFTTVNPLDADFNETLSSITEGKGFNVVYEVSGTRPGISTAMENVAIAGTVMVVGMASEAYPVELFKVFAKELTIKGVRIHSQINFVKAMNLIASGELNDQFRKLISKSFSLDQISDAFDYAEKADDFFKILIKN